ncbi:M48 family metallopeptidase [bacterium]|nr:M48 family metallopeptidase [bacterium]
MAIALAFVFAAACATVPLTGRKQLALIPDKTLHDAADSQYRSFLKQNNKSANKSDVRMVKRVGDRISDSVETYFKRHGMRSRVRGYDWEYNLIQADKTANAWCMPGGKVAVYTGILPLTQDETGLAVVMGHEIAHAAAHHSAERVSQMMLAQAGATALAVALRGEKRASVKTAVGAAYGLGVTYGALLPFSREHELEADRLGLIFMAMAGYDPREAADFWKRMGEKSGKTVEFLSTHPVSTTRVKKIRKHMRDAMGYYVARE